MKNLPAEMTRNAFEEVNLHLPQQFQYEECAHAVDGQNLAVRTPHRRNHH